MVGGDVSKHLRGQSGEKIIVSDILRQFCPPSHLSRMRERRRANEMKLGQRGHRGRVKQPTYRVPRGKVAHTREVGSAGQKKS